MSRGLFLKCLTIGFMGIVLIYLIFMNHDSPIADHDNEIASPCSAQSILTAENPDARLSHCNDQDWDGSTVLKDRLREAESRPNVYGILCQKDDIRYSYPLTRQLLDAQGALTHKGSAKPEYF